MPRVNRKSKNFLSLIPSNIRLGSMRCHLNWHQLEQRMHFLKRVFIILSLKPNPGRGGQLILLANIFLSLSRDVDAVEWQEKISSKWNCPLAPSWIKETRARIRRRDADIYALMNPKPVICRLSLTSCHTQAQKRTFCRVFKSRGQTKRPGWALDFPLWYYLFLH